MTNPKLLALHRESVRPEWIDYNDHMNVAYYVLAFDHATDAFFDYLGLDTAYRKRTGSSTFAVESHITYQREVRGGDPLSFTTQLLAYDDKRLHFFHRMHHGEQHYLVATSEWLALHIDLEQRRVSAMPEEIKARISALMAEQRSLPMPAEAGRVIGISKRKAA